MKSLEGWIVDFKKREMGERSDGCTNKGER